MLSWSRRPPEIYSLGQALEQLEERTGIDPAAAPRPDVNQVEAGPEAFQEPTAKANPGGSAATDPSGESDAHNPGERVLGSGPAEVLVSNADWQSVASAEQQADDPSEDVRILLTSSDVSGADQLATATGDDVITILCDASADPPASILTTIPNLPGDKTASSIGLAVHEAGSGTIELLDDCALSPHKPGNSVELQSFWVELGGLLLYDGRIDILSCSLTEATVGASPISQPEVLTGDTVAPSDDPTGNAAYGGDWVLETGNVDVSLTHFDPDKLTNFKDVLDSANQWSTLGEEVSMGLIPRNYVPSGELVSDFLAGNFNLTRGIP